MPVPSKSLHDFSDSRCGQAGTYVQELSGKCLMADGVGYLSNHGSLYWLLWVDRGFQDPMQREQQSARSASLQ